MPVDNSVFDALGDLWWNPENIVAAPMLYENHVRFNYFRSVLRDLRGLRILDVGCGGGILAEAFAKEGARVTGMDASASSIRAATRHAEINQLDIEYFTGKAEDIRCDSNTFDAVVAANILEHVGDVNTTLKECSRVLKPGGKFFYITVNRTVKSLMVFIWIAQYLTRASPRGVHDWNMFIRPEELVDLMKRQGIANLETRGLVVSSIWPTIRMWVLKRHIVLNLALGDDTSMNYIGYGVKR